MSSNRLAQGRGPRAGEESRYTHQPKSTNVPMWTAAVDKTPCERCGRPQWKSNRDEPTICKECRWVDPEFVEAIETGVRCA